MSRPDDTRASLALRENGFVTFRLADQWLGIPVILIQEVIAGERISPIPLSPDEVRGFLNLRGQIVTAIDLRSVLALPARDEDASFMNVVVRDDDELYSLLVDEVGDVVQATAADVEAAPRTLDPVWKQCCTGVIRLERGLLVVLDVDRVLGADPARAA